MEVPPHVGELEYTTPARTPLHRRARPQNSPPPTPPPTPPQEEVPSDPLSLLTSPDSSTLSGVVREALDDLLLNVIKQLQYDLNHGPQNVRSKIASQFLPRIMRTLDKEDQEDESQLEQLRAEMEKLNQELLHGDPVLYKPITTATPDSEDLPIVNETGVTVEQPIESTGGVEGGK